VHLTGDDLPPSQKRDGSRAARGQLTHNPMVSGGHSPKPPNVRLTFTRFPQRTFGLFLRSLESLLQQRQSAFVWLALIELVQSLGEQFAI
jgi:hypothetical protein